MRVVSSPLKPVQTDYKRLKKDAMWKPLLRHFRQFIRSSLANYVDVANLFEESGKIRPNVFEGVKAFCEEMGFQDYQKYNLGLIILLVPCQGSNLARFFSNCEEVTSALK